MLFYIVLKIKILVNIYDLFEGKGNKSKGSKNMKLS